MIGALVGLLIAGETISISSLIGALMLIGIVVTNAIVLVDRVIHKENEGMSTRDALLEAGATRLRPILMTAIATMLHRSRNRVEPSPRAGAFPCALYA